MIVSVSSHDKVEPFPIERVLRVQEGMMESEQDSGGRGKRKAYNSLAREGWAFDKRAALGDRSE